MGGKVDFFFSSVLSSFFVSLSPERRLDLTTVLSTGLLTSVKLNK